MVEVVSIKFKNRGKCYFFSPNGLEIKTGDNVIVETSKGLEFADCCRGNHPVEDTAVVQPLRPVVRIATKDDIRVAEINKQREKEAFDICQRKIEEHKLDMKLVDVECSFEGSKTMFFFTSDGRVDFRELVKDLAGIFRNRIELRQIGVRDEAKLIGGIGICGRPYCCNQFLEDFQPVSTKMAKVQSLSLNPTKISGSCGRLMCCLRYEQEAYEDLIKHVPKQGAFVQTKDGYGTAVQVDLLRQTVKVKLDGDTDDSLHVYKSNELAAVPGGRPRDGEPLPQVLNYVPEEEPEEEIVDEWVIPTDSFVVPESPARPEKPERPEKPAESEEGQSHRRRNRRRGGHRGADGERKTEKAPAAEQGAADNRQQGRQKNAKNGKNSPAADGAKPEGKGKGGHGSRSTVKPVKVEKKAPSGDRSTAEKAQADRPHTDKPRADKPQTGEKGSAGENKEGRKKNGGYRSRHYRGKPKKPAGPAQAQ